MNREILFRAKIDPDAYSYDKKFEWVYGYYTKYSCIFSGRSVIEQENDDYAVLDETVCQYTGITDKNGVKIFEGDIVRIGRYFNNNFYTEDNYVCKYDTNTASFKFYYIVPKDIADVNKYAILGDGAALSNMGRGFTIEVIGNIYDNSDLIEK